tara:strand:- start:1446 stop:1703 length:258 start_codon:yes stop_codon:yes gene_type:complete
MGHIKILTKRKSRLCLRDQISESDEEIRCLEKLLEEAKMRKIKLLRVNGKYQSSWGEWLYNYYSDIYNKIYDIGFHYSTVQDNKW